MLSWVAVAVVAVVGIVSGIGTVESDVVGVP